MSKTDIAVIEVVFGIIGFALGMTMPQETHAIWNGIDGAIMGVGAGAILCIVIIRFSKK